MDESDAIWYDPRWVLAYEQSPLNVLACDLLVLITTLATSVALFYITRPDQLLECNGVTFDAMNQDDCLFSEEKVRSTLTNANGALGPAQVQDHCQPVRVNAEG